MVAYALMQFPSGLLADRFGSVRVVAAGGLVTVVGAFLLVVDAPFVVLAGAMLLLGGGTGAYKTVSVGLLSQVYPARTGRALGAYDTFGSLAGVAAPAAVVVFASEEPYTASTLVFLSAVALLLWRPFDRIAGWF